MPASVWSPDVRDILAAATHEETTRVSLDGRPVEVRRPFPSPADWRDIWIYQIMVDRFNDPTHGPLHQPWDGIDGRFQGGSFNGIRQQLGYLQRLGVGALWLTPVFKNCLFQDTTYHGYGIQDFLALDPRFASNPDAARTNPQIAEDEFRALVDEAHARGMYVILDIVLNHAGDVFEYDGFGSLAPSSGQMYTINWRDETGRGRTDWHEAPQGASRDAAIYPEEFRRNAFFRRRGVGGEGGGDFFSLKEFVTDFHDFSPEHGHHDPVRNALIRAHQYAIARYDIDGFRIDTLKFIEPEFARTFANGVRELALSIGKRNFFTFGEVYDNEEKIARFIGRSANEAGEPIGVDAALDFPLFFSLPSVVKGFRAPTDLAGVFEHRKEVQRGLLSTHGDASKYFVTFLDNHDQHERFHFSDPSAPHRYDDQVTLGIACLFALQGVPCLYYGTEQGLHSTQERYRPNVNVEQLPPEAVREALWGKNGAGAFDSAHPFYLAIQRLSLLRNEQPALRYGRQYFRPISGDGSTFGISPFNQGVIAFSRLLNDTELLIVANTQTQASWSGEVIVDFALNPVGTRFQTLYRNKGQNPVPGPVVEKAGGSIAIHEVDGAIRNGPARVIPVSLEPMEVQILGKAS